PRRAGLRLDILGGTLVVIIAAGPFRDLLILSGPGLMMVKATWVLLYAAAIFLLFRSVGIRRVQWAAVVGWSILLPVLIACLSPAWSIDPGISLRRAVSLIGCTLIGIYIGMRFSPHDFVRILFYSFVIIVAASVVVVVL